MDLVDPIAELEAKVFPELALSLYLPATRRFQLRYQESVFRELAHRYSEQFLDTTSIAVLKRELPAVTAYLELKRPPIDHSLAVFACRPARLLSSWALPEQEDAILRVGHRIHAAPLRRQLALHPPALIVAVDEEKACVFTMVLGEIEQVAEFQGREVKHHRQGGWSALSYQRREDILARGNLDEVVHWLSSERGGFFRAIHLAGPGKARSQLKRLLPSRVRSRLGVDLRAPLYLPPTELAERFRSLRRMGTQ